MAGDVLTTATADAEGAARIEETAETAAPAEQAPQASTESEQTPASRPQRRTPARQSRQEARNQAGQQTASPAQPAPSPGVSVRRRLARLGAQRGSGMNPVLEPLIKTIRAHHPKADVHLVERAYEVAAHWHKDQKRKSGDPYITHPLAVATILAELGMNTETICAALLHDTVEDTAYTLTELRSDFGEDVAALVDGVTKLDKVKYGASAEAETVRKMVVAMSRDIRVLVIKLADRLHNMRTLRYMPRDKQERKSRETLEIYAPLAHRLGMNTVKWELEDLAFATLYPKRYDEIARLVSQRSPRRDQLLQEVITDLSADMHEARIKGTVSGRPKHYYSIYQKMIARNVEFDDIYDLVGIRVLVDTVRDCYAALGTIHARWNPVPGRFKDYIAMPKFNMYQSLHTTVIGPGGKPVELQIRTWGMHKRAEYGVAAHWKYKEDMVAHGPVLPGGVTTEKDKAKKGDEAAEMAWLRQLVDWQRETEDPAEFLDSLRFDLAGAEVYVFTPRGEVIALPQGATPVDFAYAIHTDIGHRTIGARDQRPPRRPRVHPGQRRHGGDLHLQGAGGRPEPRLAELRQERPGEEQDPPVVLQGAPRGRGRGGQGPDRQGHAEAGPAAAAPDVRRRRSARSPATSATRTCPACTRRSARAGSAPSRWSPRWSARSAARSARKRTWPSSPPSRRRSPAPPGQAPPPTPASRWRARPTSGCACPSAAPRCRAMRSRASSPTATASPCTARTA